MKSIYDIKTTGKFTPTQTFREKKAVVNIGRMESSMKKLNKGLAKMAKERHEAISKKGGIMKTIFAILCVAMLAFASEDNIQYGVRTESVKTEDGYLGTYQFNDTTLTIHFAKRAVSHVRYDFVNNKLYTNGNGVAKDGTVVPPPPQPEEKMQEIRQWNP